MARKMKDSGIEWIGEIPEGWEVAPLKRFASIQTGNTPSKTSDANYYAANGIPWIKPDNLGYSHPILTTSEYLTSEGALCARIMPPNTVYVCCIGSLGKVGYSSISCACNQQINALIFNDLMFWRYGYYLTIAQESQYLLFGNGNVLQIINSTSQGNIACVLPPLENQHLIACYLDSICSDIEVLISKARSSIEEYKKLKQTVITQAVTKGVRGEREMKDSGVDWIGEIPVDWTIQRFARVAEVKSNLVSPDNYLEYPQISPENIEKDSGKLLLPCRTVAEVGVISGNHLFYKGQILYSKIRPKLNKVCIAPFDGLCSADMYPIESKNDTRYIMYCILSNGFLQQVSMITENRVKMPKINQVELSKVLVAIPETIAEQKEIADYLAAKCAEIDGLIAKKEQLVKELESYKKSLIYEVVTGKRET